MKIRVRLASILDFLSFGLQRTNWSASHADGCGLLCGFDRRRLAEKAAVMQRYPCDMRLVLPWAIAVSIATDGVFLDIAIKVISVKVKKYWIMWLSEHIWLCWGCCSGLCGVFRPDSRPWPPAYYWGCFAILSSLVCRLLVDH